jgi:hypothetical protein
MPIPGIIAGAAAVLQIAGAIQGANAQAGQEQQNAEYYRRQAEYAAFSAQRDAQLARFQYAQKIGTQGSKYAQGNVALGTGASMATMGTTYAQMLEEIWAIEKKGKLEADLGYMRAASSRDRASALTDPMTTLFTVGSIGLNAYTSWKYKGG